MSDTTPDCEETLLYQAEYDPSDRETLTESIIEAVATVEEIPPLELRPLYETVDIESLTNLMTHATSDSRNSTVSVEFTLEQLLVVVKSSGLILVYEDAAEKAGNVNAIHPEQSCIESN